MKRRLSDSLDRWLADPARRPLVLCGARQVGKTWLVRDLAARAGRELVEVNFELDPAPRRHFTGDDPREILDGLSHLLGREIRPHRSLLFLDEVQVAGEALAKLRSLAREMPGLPVVAAVSLPGLTPADRSKPMPADGVAFRQLEPLSLPEYLDARGAEPLRSALEAWRPGLDLPASTHDAATEWFHRYLMVGGMPAVVAADAEGRPGRMCRETQKDLVATLRADFPKYCGRMYPGVLGDVLSTVAASLGREFVYARAGVEPEQAMRALDLMAGARIVSLIRTGAADGPRLGAGAGDSFRRAVLLDVGILHALFGTPAADGYPSPSALPPSLRGRLAEQIAAQQLRLRGAEAGDGPELYCRQREGSRAGAVDHLIEAHGLIVPIQLLPGPAGAREDLHQFMFDRRLALAVRCDANPPGIQDLSVLTTRGDPVRYRLVSLPDYLLWNVEEVLASAIERS